ncbi:hypothetical protein SAOR_05530 [Salinisphaera orenii MK-B5]|uniref:Uncharacterized protein n=1 Tax=Salinisphaera orenii MK-B5 TaxID=856730 RepID=A0A423PT22_9GAMM|nr:hypothetical protein SAOR_05530 [Salinisphaera orenii MK-B5]
MAITDPDSLEPFRKDVLIKLRIGARSWHGAHIHDVLDPDVSQQGDQLIL